MVTAGAGAVPAGRYNGRPARSQARVPAVAARIDEVIGELDVIKRQIRDTIADLAADQRYRL